MLQSDGTNSCRLPPRPQWTTQLRTTVSTDALRSAWHFPPESISYAMFYLAADVGYHCPSHGQLPSPRLQIFQDKRRVDQWFFGQLVRAQLKSSDDRPVFRLGKLIADCRNIQMTRLFTAIAFVRYRHRRRPARFIPSKTSRQVFVNLFASWVPAVGRLSVSTGASRGSCGSTPNPVGTRRQMARFSAFPHRTTRMGWLAITESRPPRLNLPIGASPAKHLFICNFRQLGTKKTRYQSARRRGG